MSRIHACRPAAFVLALGLVTTGAAFADQNPGHGQSQDRATPLQPIRRQR